MILTLGGPDDAQAAAVQAELERRGIDSARFDPDRGTGIGIVSLALASAGRLDGVVHASGRGVHVEDVRAVWVGKPGPFTGSPVLDDLWDVLDVPMFPAAPMVTSRATHELRQLQAASAAGFEIPGTFMSEGLDARVDCMQSHVNERSRIRAVVAGEKVFAAICQPGDSAGAPGAAVNPFVLPLTEAARCKHVVQALGLDYAVLELTGTDEGGLVFRSLDPHGDFDWAENLARFPVTRAIVDRIVERSHSSERLSARSRPSLQRSRRLHPSYAGNKKLTRV